MSYAPDRSRWKQISTYAGGSETTIYVGGLLEKLTTPTRAHWKHLIPTPSGQVQFIRRTDGTKDTFYVTTDHLGSTDAVLNAAGTVLMRGSFGVHGARRASNWQGAPSSAEWQAIADTTRRGYTGHEQIDNVMVVHMNGRAFDPVIGRFLSADPYIDGVETTQGWNRYAYVHGNLLSATDPSGYDAPERGFTVRSWINYLEPTSEWIINEAGDEEMVITARNVPQALVGVQRGGGAIVGTEHVAGHYQTPAIDVIEAITETGALFAPAMEWTARIEGMMSAAQFFARTGAVTGTVGVIIDLSQGNLAQAAVNGAIIIAVPTAVMLGYPVAAGAIAVGGAVYGVVQIAGGD